MGFEIVYCGQCAVQVRGVDLDKGHAIRVDGQAYCAKCAPEIRASLPPPAPRSSTSRIPVVTNSSSGHRKAVAGTTPHPVRKPDRRPLMAGAAAGGALLLIVVLAMALRGGEAPKKAVEPAPAPAPKPKPAERPDTAKILNEIEALFLMLRNDDTLGILTRIQEAKPLLRGSPQEAKLAAIEAQVLEAKKIADRERQAEMGLAQVRSIRSTDRRFQQKAEVIRLLESTIKLGVSRSIEARRMLQEYTLEADAAAARLLEITGWYRFVSADLLGKDDSGRGNDATGLEGATWNGSRGVRFQGSGAIVIPASIPDDYTIALFVKTQQKHAGGDQWWKGVGLVDGEMPGIVEDFGTSMLGGKFSAGVGKPDVTLVSKSDINDGRWHHVAATRDGKSGELRIYVDGAFEGSASASRGPRKETTRLTIGTLQTGDGRFAGELDDLRLFARVLNADEIRELAKR